MTDPEAAALRAQLERVIEWVDAEAKATKMWMYQANYITDRLTALLAVQNSVGAAPRAEAAYWTSALVLVADHLRDLTDEKLIEKRDKLMAIVRNAVFRLSAEAAASSPRVEPEQWTCGYCGSLFVPKAAALSSPPRAADGK